MIKRCCIAQDGNSPPQIDESLRPNSGCNTEKQASHIRNRPTDSIIESDVLNNNHCSVSNDIDFVKANCVASSVIRTHKLCHIPSPLTVEYPSQRVNFAPGRHGIPILGRPTIYRAPQPTSPELLPASHPPFRHFSETEVPPPMLRHPLQPVPGRIPAMPSAPLPQVDYGYYYGE